MQRRLSELQARSETEFDRIERAGLYVLDREGFEALGSVTHMSAEAPNRWACWAAETIVWCARRLRNGEFREAMRGYAQLAEYRGRNGGFLPYQMSDQFYAIQNCLEKMWRER